jgi:hypothetical protein
VSVAEQLKQVNPSAARRNVGAEYLANTLVAVVLLELELELDVFVHTHSVS